MDLLKAFNNKMTELKNDRDAAAAFFKTQPNTLAKFLGGSGNLPIAAYQALIDELIDRGELMQRQPGREKPQHKPEPAKQEPAPTSQTLEVKADAVVAFVNDRAKEFDPDDRRDMVEALSNEARKDVIVLIAGHQRLDDAPLGMIQLLTGLTRGLKCAGVDVASFDSVDHSRNILLDNFSKGEIDWAVMLDPWVLPPFGNAAAFRARTGSPFAPEFIGLNVLDRLTKGEGRLIVGGVHEGLNDPNHLSIQPDLEPRSDDDKALVTMLKDKGPTNRIAEVPWLDCSLVAIHRRVLSDIRATHGDLMPSKAGAPFPYFQPSLDPLGSSKNFCELAAKAGHKVHLDLAVRASVLNRRLRA